MQLGASVITNENAWDAGVCGTAKAFRKTPAPAEEHELKIELPANDGSACPHHHPLLR
jgi:hypothetical protein